MQGSRFERKYIITEEQSLQVRDFIRTHLDLDEHGVGRPNFSYPVHSIYLDSDDLKLYWSTINDDEERFKLRLRFYDDNPVKPVFLEVRQRIDKRIVKKRAAVHREAVEWLLTGDGPKRSHVVSNDAKDFAVLEEVCRAIYEIDARPKVHVAYSREAYVSRRGNSARLTMDREVRVEPEGTTRFSMNMQNPTLVWGKEVVLELKYTGKFPDVFLEMVRIFGLRRCGAAKYVDSVATLGEYKLPGSGAG